MPSAAAAPGWSVWPAPAKLNLFLQIVGRRSDGYHQLQSVFQLLDWGDQVRLRVREDASVRRVEGNATVREDTDLAVRAARLLQAHTGCRLGCEIAIDKRIPMGGGFGGGSSDAATVLVALDRLWDIGLGEERLAALGLTLGADVPVFVRGRSAWAEGIGERLLAVDLPPRWYLIVDPGVHVPTAELFRTPELTRDAVPTTMQAFVAGAVSGNAFEAVLRRRELRIAAALDDLARFGRSGITGSGGGCFVGFNTLQQAECACREVEDRWTAWIAGGVNRSPLLERLEQRL